MFIVLAGTASGREFPVFSTLELKWQRPANLYPQMTPSESKGSSRMHISRTKQVESEDYIRN